MAIEVFFGTNRRIKKRNQNQQAVDFGTKVNKHKPLLHFGKARISDNAEDIEEIITSRDTFSEQLCCNQDIFNEIQDRMYKDIDTILFFHGFYHTFKDSLIGAAELKHLYEKESGSEYSMIVFSWPSEGRLFFTYNKDQQDARISSKVMGPGIYQLAQFLTELCWLKFGQKTNSDIVKNKNTQEKRFGCGRLHIMAHSMGNYVLRYVLQELLKITAARIPQLFNEILLIAADEDRDTFEYGHKLKFLPELAQRVSLYFNQEDVLLKISDWFMNDMDRLGLEGPFHPSDLPDNVSLIDCRNVVDGFLEHHYHKAEPAVIRDIAYVLNGWRSKDMPGRIYSQETNSYRLMDLEKEPVPPNITL